MKAKNNRENRRNIWMHLNIYKSNFESKQHWNKTHFVIMDNKKKKKTQYLRSTKTFSYPWSLNSLSIVTHLSRWDYRFTTFFGYSLIFLSDFANVYFVHSLHQEPFLYHEAKKYFGLKFLCHCILAHLFLQITILTF